MDVLMPQLGETVTEGTVTVWRKQVGDRVEAGEPLFEVTTDKVDTEVPAPGSGVLSAILVAAGKTVKVGERLAILGEGAASSASSTQSPTRSAPAGVGDTHRDAVGPPDQRPAMAGADERLSPVVRKLLGEHGLQAAEIRGTGEGGRITRRDVLEHLERRNAGPRTSGERAPLGPIRKRTAEQMALSWRTIPHVLQAIEVDFHAVEQARGGELTYLPFVASAVCEAIAAFPLVNGSFDGDAVVLHPRVHLGIAVDLGAEGLIVPVLKDAATKSLRELSDAIRSLSTKARSRQLRPDDVTEGTYTISNSGRFGTLLTAPIINPPQVAILSLDGVARRPAVVGDSVMVRPIGVLAQSFDHRAFDGAYSAAFLRRVKEILESRDWRAALGA